MYEFERIDLELMEQIYISDEKREGKAIAQEWLDAYSSIPPETTKLRVYKEYVSIFLTNLEMMFLCRLMEIHSLLQSNISIYHF